MGDCAELELLRHICDAATHTYLIRNYTSVTELKQFKNPHLIITPKICCQDVENLCQPSCNSWYGLQLCGDPITRAAHHLSGALTSPPFHFSSYHERVSQFPSH